MQTGSPVLERLAALGRASRAPCTCRSLERRIRPSRPTRCSPAGERWVVPDAGHNTLLFDEDVGGAHHPASSSGASLDCVGPGAAGREPWYRGAVSTSSRSVAATAALLLRLRCVCVRFQPARTSPPGSSCGGGTSILDQSGFPQRRAGIPDRYRARFVSQGRDRIRGPGSSPDSVRRWNGSRAIPPDRHRRLRARRMGRSSRSGDVWPAVARPVRPGLRR